MHMICIKVQQLLLVHCLSKECSSAQCKEIFKRIQLRDEDGHVPSEWLKQLLMDMKVWWSSTYVMLEWAESLKEDINYFVGRLGLQEKDAEKAQKLLMMQLTAAKSDACYISLAYIHSILTH